jgi:hypothetical protein
MLHFLAIIFSLLIVCIFLLMNMNMNMNENFNLKIKKECSVLEQMIYNGILSFQKWYLSQHFKNLDIQQKEVREKIFYTLIWHISSQFPKVAYNHNEKICADLLWHKSRKIDKKIRNFEKLYDGDNIDDSDDSDDELNIEYLSKRSKLLNPMLENMREIYMRIPNIFSSKNDEYFKLYLIGNNVVSSFPILHSNHNSIPFMCLFVQEYIRNVGDKIYLKETLNEILDYIPSELIIIISDYTYGQVKHGTEIVRDQFKSGINVSNYEKEENYFVINTKPGFLSENICLKGIYDHVEVEFDLNVRIMKITINIVHPNAREENHHVKVEISTSINE